jgi:hypothetical protein
MVRKLDPEPTYDGPKEGHAFERHQQERILWTLRQRRRKAAAEARTAASFAKHGVPPIGSEAAATLYTVKLATPPASVILAHGATCGAGASDALLALLPATLGGDVTNLGIASHEKLPWRPRIDTRVVAMEWLPPNLNAFPGKLREAAESGPQLWYQQMTGEKWNLEMSDWNKQTRRHRRLIEDEAAEKVREQEREPRDRSSRVRPSDDAARRVAQRAAQKKRHDEMLEKDADELAALFDVMHDRFFMRRQLLMHMMKDAAVLTGFDVELLLPVEFGFGDEVSLDRLLAGKPAVCDNPRYNPNHSALIELLQLRSEFDNPSPKADLFDDGETGFVLELANLCSRP